MEGVEIRFPQPSKPLRVFRSQLSVDARNHDSDVSPFPKEATKVGKIHLVGAKVVIGVEADYGIEKVRGEWKSVSFNTKRENGAVQFGVQDTLHVVVGIDPQIGRPYLEAVLPGEEDRTHCPTTTQVEYAHPAANIKALD